jgi:chromate transport protein ChrA
MVGLRTAIFGMILVTLVRMGVTLLETSMETPIQVIVLLSLTLMLFKPLKNRPYLLLMVGAVFGIFFL